LLIVATLKTLEFTRKYLTKLILKQNALMEHLACCTLMKAVKKINSLFSFKEEDIVAMLLFQKQSKIVTKEARHI